MLVILGQSQKYHFSYNRNFTENIMFDLNRIEKWGISDISDFYSELKLSKK